jgi:hypothetical protein
LIARTLRATRGVVRARAAGPHDQPAGLATVGAASGRKGRGASPGAAKSSAARRSTAKAAANPSAGKRGAAKAPAGKATTAVKTTAVKSTAGKSAAGKATSAKPSVAKRSAANRTRHPAAQPTEPSGRRRRLAWFVLGIAVAGLGGWWSLQLRGLAGTVAAFTAVAAGTAALAALLGGRFRRWLGRDRRPSPPGRERGLARAALSLPGRTGTEATAASPRVAARPVVVKDGARPGVLLEAARRDLATVQEQNPLVPLAVAGTLSRRTLAEFAAEQYHLVSSDRRSLLFFASRYDDAAGGSFFAELAESARLALDLLMMLADGVGLDRAELDGYEPRPGCQAYPAYVAWLAQNGAAPDVALALTADIHAWGTSCATFAQALREQPGHGLDDQAYAFFDFQATLATQVEPEALNVVQSCMNMGVPPDPVRVRRYARLLGAYRRMFWTTLARPE